LLRSCREGVLRRVGQQALCLQPEPCAHPVTASLRSDISRNVGRLHDGGGSLNDDNDVLIAITAGYYQGNPGLPADIALSH
jgi:hypothetical protein